MSRYLLVPLLALLAAPALAAPPLTPADRARLDGLDEAVGRALRQVLTLPGDDADRKAALSALSGPVVGVDPATLAGDWSCRTVKMGRTSPAVAYPPFACRIAVEGGVVTLEKRNGSQRLRGTVDARDGQQVFVGVGYIAGDNPPGYEALPPGDGAASDPQRVPVVGLLEMTGPDRGRLLMPSPVLESDLDLLEISR